MQSPLLQRSVHFVWRGFLPQEITSLIPDCFSRTKAQGIPQFQRGGLHLEVARNVTKNGTQRSVFASSLMNLGLLAFASFQFSSQALIPNIRDCIHHAASFLHRFLSHVTHVGPARLAPCGKPVWALVLLALCMQ